MKNLTAFLFLILLALTLSASGATTPRETATIVFTNQPVTGNTISINGITQTWTNNTPANVFYDVIQGQQTNSAGYLYTNTVNNTLLGSQFIVTYDLSNTVTVLGPLGSTFAVATNGAWCSVTLTTNLYQVLYTVVTPMSGQAQIPQTNIPTLVTIDLSTYSQTPFVTGTILMTNFVDIPSAQFITGAKTLSNSATAIIGGSLSNVMSRGSFTNTAVIVQTNATGTNILSAAGFTNKIGGIVTVEWSQNSFNLPDVVDAPFTMSDGGGNQLWQFSGNVFEVNGGSSIQWYSGFGGLLGNEVAQISSADGSGWLANSNLTWTATGQLTDSNLVTGVAVALPNHVLTTTTNLNGLNIGGTNTWSGDLAYMPLSISSLANGNNSDLPISTNVYCRLSGPTGAFSIAGIVGGRDGRILTLQYSGGQAWTILNNSGVDPTPANRIFTGTGASITMTNVPGFVQFIYDNSATVWMVIQHSN